jgi:hypothetical protein
VEAYKRNITIKLLLLRVFFLIAVTASIFFFLKKRNDYGFVIATFLLLASIIPISKLKIEEDSFTIVQYYLFGFIPRKQVFMKGDDISIYKFDISFSESDISYLTSGSFLDLLLTPTTLGTLKRYAIERKDFYGDTKKFKMKLSEKEYALIKDNFVATPVNHVELSND